MSGRLSLYVVSPEITRETAALFAGDLVEPVGRGLHRVAVDPATGVADRVRLTRAECARLAYVTTVGCVECERGTPVSHLGSSFCRSGSLRAGGLRSHCTCDTCF